MCGIAGFVDFSNNFLGRNEQNNKDTLIKMRQKIKHRGCDQTGEYLDKSFGFSHTRLSIRDLSNGTQPMIRYQNGKKYVICYNGEIYNTLELRKLLENDFIFETTCDTEVILYCYMKFGCDFVKNLNGIFAFSIFDEAKNQVFLARDHVGVKPLFYTLKNNELIFGSEIKALFEHEKVHPSINLDSFREIFGIGPARTMGCGVFEDIFELKSGHYAIFSEYGLKITQYWDMVCKEHTDSYDETVDKVSFLVRDAIEKQLISDVPICSFLSGGIDSSIITAIAQKSLGDTQLNTYSFDFKGNDEFFVGHSFQKERDRPFVDIMKEHVGTNHTYLECDESELVNLLETSMKSKDLPGMADVDASLLYFCKIVKQENQVALTGECADEIFGGYPWFYREDLLNCSSFPWSNDTQTRELLLKSDFTKKLDLSTYSHQKYVDTIKNVPILENDTLDMKKHREITYLNIKWFMQTLLDRMDRASMHSGLEGRVPFADFRIIDYVFNVPFSMKRKNGVEKSLLRDAFNDILPNSLINRKKTPYPKTYNPNFEKLLRDKMLSILDDSNSPINEFIDKNSVLNFFNNPIDYQKPWFGQLMSGPQLIAYILQTNSWLLEYNPKINL